MTGSKLPRTAKPEIFAQAKAEKAEQPGGCLPLTTRDLHEKIGFAAIGSLCEGAQKHFAFLSVILCLCDAAVLFWNYFLMGRAD